MKLQVFIATHDYSKFVFNFIYSLKLNQDAFERTNELESNELRIMVFCVDQKVVHPVSEFRPIGNKRKY